MFGNVRKRSFDLRESYIFGAGRVICGNYRMPWHSKDENLTYLKTDDTYHFYYFDELKTKPDVDSLKGIFSRQKVNAVVTAVKHFFMELLFKVHIFIERSFKKKKMYSY